MSRRIFLFEPDMYGFMEARFSNIESKEELFMIKLGMDVRMIRHSGIGVRVQNILKYWKENKQIQIYLFGDPEILKDYSLPTYKEIIPYHAPIYSIHEWWGHPKMKEMDCLDIPHFNAPLRYLSKCQVTIHDLIPWVMRQFHSTFLKRLYLNLILHRVLKYSRRIITVSEYTRSDIWREFPQIRDTIEVAPNGIDHNLYKPHSQKDIESFRKKYSLPSNFFLTVGIGKGHKNQEFLMDCMEQEWRKNSELCNLVIAGTGGNIPDYLRDVYSRNSSKIFFLPRIPDEEMPLLYQAADILIYPSLYEGFGFPVVEASSVSTLVLASNATVLPEVLGEGAIFFDPKSKEDFSDKLYKALNLTPNEKKNILSLSRHKSLSYNWQNTVDIIQSGIV